MAQSDRPVEGARAVLSDALQQFPHEDIIAALEAQVPAGSGVGEMIVYRSPKLTMLYARVPARFRSGIHNHTVCACIGQLAGVEKSVIYERSADGKVTPTQTISIKKGEVMTLEDDAIHHIENPTDAVSSALHLYGGDFAALMGERSLWAAETGHERPFSFEGLVEQSIRAMKLEGNDRGLEAVSEAIPAARALISAL